jgi:2-phospho-L-lactate guanylyltransferase
MRTLAVLPIKGFSAAKQRLAQQLASGSRQALAQAMFSDVLNALRHVELVEAVAVVTADQVASLAVRGERLFVIQDDARAGQSAAAKIGVRHAQASGFDRVLLVPGDAPLLDPREVDRLLRTAAADELGVAIVPDRHEEGTNALILCPPDAIEPSFGPGSLARHIEAAEASGLPYRVERPESLLLDVDTPEDLVELSARLEHLRGVAPMTRGALRQLGRARTRTAVGAPASMAGSASAI